MARRSLKLPEKIKLPVGRELVYKVALEDDLDMLIGTFQRKQSYNFPTFSNNWTREKYQRTLFLEVKLGSLYALYLLFFTQPEIFKDKVRIRVTSSSWASLLEIYQYCQKHKLHDAAYIFRTMKKKSAFLFVAFVDPCQQYGVVIGPKDEKQVISYNRRKIFKKMSDLREEMSQFSLGGLENSNTLDEIKDISNAYYSKINIVARSTEAIDVSDKYLQEWVRENELKKRDYMAIVSPLTSSNSNMVDDATCSVQNLKKRRYQILSNSQEVYDGSHCISQKGENSEGDDPKMLTSHEVRNNLRQQSYKNRYSTPFPMAAISRATEKTLEPRQHSHFVFNDELLNDKTGGSFSFRILTSSHVTIYIQCTGRRRENYLI
ncbi:hypothetical protein G9A89_022040 [Geosiphon pyriformis]|nr:hypothetical protein G9A89_022040 [Geosiphon pyriformis]